MAKTWSTATPMFFSIHKKFNLYSDLSSYLEGSCTRTCQFWLILLSIMRDSKRHAAQKLTVILVWNFNDIGSVLYALYQAQLASYFGIRLSRLKTAQLTLAAPSVASVSAAGLSSSKSSTSPSVVAVSSIAATASLLCCCPCIRPGLGMKAKIAAETFKPASRGFSRACVFPYFSRRTDLL